MVTLFNYVDHDLAVRVAEGIGAPAPPERVHPSITAPTGRRNVERSPALSLEHLAKDTIKSLRIAVLAADGVDANALQIVKKALEEKGAHVFIIAKGLGSIKGAKGQEVPVDASAITASSVMYDAVFIPGGQESVSQLLRPGRARHFVAEAFKHGKPIGAVGEGVELLVRSDLPGLPSAGALSNGGLSNSNGIVTMRNMSEMNSFIQQFTAAIAKRRHWSRLREQVPA